MIQILIFHKNINKSVKYYNDEDLTQMLYEYIEILYNVVNNQECMYSKWITDSIDNYKYLYVLCKSLYNEIIYRFGTLAFSIDNIIDESNKIYFKNNSFTTPNYTELHNYILYCKMIYINNYRNNTWTKRLVPKWIYKLNYNLNLKHINRINRGTNAGGYKTNLYGKLFENKTNSIFFLMSNGYTKIYIDKTNKYSFYLFKQYNNRNIYIVYQNGLKHLLKLKYNIDIFRCPDEAILIETDNITNIIIIEKKEQKTNGSIETKLWASPSLKREYELVLGKNFKIDYYLCLNDYLKSKIQSKHPKYIILNTILKEHNIKIIYGDEHNYFDIFNTF